MSTRSLVGAETDSGIRLVYVHSDGYPDGYWGKVETLQRLIAEYGVSRVVATLLQTTSGWSSFDGNPGDESSAGHTDGRFELIPGFGVRYTLTELPGWNGEPMVQGNLEYDTPATALDADADYLYVIAADGKTLRYAENYGEYWDALNWTEVAL